MNIEQIFEQETDEFLRFEKVENKLNRRPDLHAFLLLDKLLPDNKNIISASLHDEFYLSITVEDLEKVISKEEIIELIRCGVRYDSQYNSLYMLT